MDFIVPMQKTPETDKIALIDADYIKYLVVNDMFKDIKAKNAHIYKNPIHTYTQERLDNIFNSFKCKGFIFCFSGPSDNTFRCAVAYDKRYKGNRPYVENYENEHKDKLNVIEYVKERYPTLVYGDLEADDLLSMLQDNDTFIYSNDKDLLQIPGMHFDIKEGVFKEVSKQEALEFLMKQMIMGDTTDNISGIKGLGQVAAFKLLDNVPVKKQPYTVMLEYMKKYGMSDGIDSFVESWNLLKLRTNRGDYFLSKYKGAFDLLRMIKNQ